MKAIDIKFRCSSLGYLMANPKSKSELISETTKTHLVDCYISAYYKRREELTSKFLDKGNAREEDSITLLSRVSKVFYKKNDERLTNDFITGEPDLFTGKDINNADETLDTKTSWSLHTFLRAKQKELESNYKWQGVGYMWLTGAKKHTVSYCLVNGTEEAITSEKRRLQWSMNIIDKDAPNPEFKRRCKQIEINLIFDLKAFLKEYPWFDFDCDIETWTYDIPMEERTFSVTIERNEEDILNLQNRIEVCRQWMDENLFNHK